MARGVFGTVLVAVLLVASGAAVAQPICRENELGQTICAVAPPPARAPGRIDDTGTPGLPRPSAGLTPTAPALIPSQRTNNLGQTFPLPGDLQGAPPRPTCRRDNLGHLRCQ
jgi:hypothetical protein